MNNLLTRNFNGTNVEMIIGENGEPLFELYSVGMALGYIKIDFKNGKEYLRVRKDRIDKVVENADIEPFAHGGRKYLTEEMIYDFMFEAKTEKCKEFRKWLSNEVLPSIRKYGVYQDREDIDEEYLKYNYNALNKTFTECSLELLSEEYDKCMKWHIENKTRIPYKANSKRRKDATKTHSDSKIMIMQKIVKTLENRNSKLLENGATGFVVESDKVIKRIKDDINKQNNKSSRGKIGGKTRKINKLINELNN